MSAQRLYGLAEGRFIHDEQGVKSKFHPDDMDRMWSRVTQALDPEGDGRYEVEYRVKQPDASWRWLSAWGLVEFEGQGATRKPIAIAGASRDISEAKRTEDLERLLGNEINHRVRNTLATVQSIVLQSLRGAVDLKSARRAVDARITALAGAHELLTDRSWLGADIKDVVARAVAPFASGCITVNGPSLDVSPKQALAHSLALHELATNAVKHGALSQHGGRVELLWNTQKEQLNLSWRETGGPHVVPPSRREFGSRLLKDGLSRDFEGETQLEFLPEGVCCWITLSRSDRIESDFAATTVAGSNDVQIFPTGRTLTKFESSRLQVTGRYKGLENSNYEIRVRRLGDICKSRSQPNTECRCSPSARTSPVVSLVASDTEVARLIGKMVSTRGVSRNSRLHLGLALDLTSPNQCSY